MKQRVVLYAEPGMVLTDGNVYGRQIFLSDSTSIDKFTEITETEYEEILREQEAKAMASH